MSRMCSASKTKHRLASGAAMLLLYLALLAPASLAHPPTGELSGLGRQPSESDWSQYHERVVLAANDPMAPRSGASASYRLAIGDSLNLFNLFNVFRGSKSDLLDDSGNLIALDDDVLATSSVWLPSGQKKPQQQKLSANAQDALAIRRPNTDQANRLAAPPASPVIMVPGYGGSRLEARWSKPSVVRYFCDHSSDWSDVWINVKMLLPYMIDCLIDNLRLEFDQITNTTHNTVGVEIRVKNSSQVSSVEYLHSLPISGFAYFAPIADLLVDELGYQRELNLRGAPYDFRKAPNELADYFERLRDTCELLFATNKRKAVTLVCHSMGCNNMLYFLQRQSKAWKAAHIRRLISLAAPWGGSLSALRATAIGDDLGMPYLFSESKLIQVQRSLPSTIYLFPHKKAFPDVPLIRANLEPTSANSSGPLDGQPGEGEEKSTVMHTTTTKATTQDHKTKVYSAHNFEDFFEAINHKDGYRMWQQTRHLLGELEPPEVELWCLVGVGQKTLGRMEYKGEFPHSVGEELYDNGDGTVSVQSAAYCKQWSTEQAQPIYYKEFFVSHNEILKQPEVLNYIERILSREIRG